MIPSRTFESTKTTACCQSHDVFEIVGLLSGAPGTPASPPNQVRCVRVPTFTVAEYVQNLVLPSLLVTVQVALHFFRSGPGLVA